MKKIFISIALIAASLFNINGQSKLSENTTLAIACETPIGIDNQNAITIIENNVIVKLDGETIYHGTCVNLGDGSPGANAR